jgi:hypothetical protein
MDDGVQFLIEPESSTGSLSRSLERNKKETYSKRRPAYSMTNDRVSPAETSCRCPADSISVAWWRQPTPKARLIVHIPMQTIHVA